MVSPSLIAPTAPARFGSAAPTTGLLQKSYLNYFRSSSTIPTTRLVTNQFYFGDMEKGRKIVNSKVLSVVNGMPSISFDSVEVEQLSVPFKLALVGKFFLRVPRIFEITKFLKNLDLKSSFSVSFVNKTDFLVRVSLEEDFNRLWSMEHPNVAGNNFRFCKWSADMSSEVDSPLVPVWVSIHRLPTLLYHKEAIFEVGKLLGKPLQVDGYTANQSKLSSASICIEMDISKPLPNQLWIEISNNGAAYNLSYGKRPVYCNACMRMGHSVTNCPTKKTGLVLPVNNHLQDFVTAPLPVSTVAQSTMPFDGRGTFSYGRGGSRGRGRGGSGGRGMSVEYRSCEGPSENLSNTFTSQSPEVRVEDQNGTDTEVDSAETHDILGSIHGLFVEGGDSEELDFAHTVDCTADPSLVTADCVKDAAGVQIEEDIISQGTAVVVGLQEVAKTAAEPEASSAPQKTSILKRGFLNLPAGLAANKTPKKPIIFDKYATARTRALNALREIKKGKGRSNSPTAYFSDDELMNNVDPFGLDDDLSNDVFSDDEDDESWLQRYANHGDV